LLVVFSLLVVVAATSCRQGSYTGNRANGGMMGQGGMGPGMMTGGQTEGSQQIGSDVGSQIFARNCGGCHPNGGNAIMPNRPIIGSKRLGSFNTFLTFIRNPDPPMPTFPPYVISDSQAMNLYQFIEKELNK
jgi:mono/diheme cytochrome c family protein